MQFTGGYIYPPRPHGNVSPGGGLFQRLESDPNWIAQAKLNGQNALIYVEKDGGIRWFNRHHRVLNFEPMPEQVDFFRSLRAHAPLVLNCELLDKQTKTFKKHLYVYDVLVADGEYLIGTTWLERQKILDRLLGVGLETPFRFAKRVGPQVWRAQNFSSAWGKLFQQYAELEIFEGVILKNSTGTLQPGFREQNNTAWAIRSRKARTRG